jgi:hypothetical protein
MTRRSRSSFDLRDALSTAEALSPKPPSVETPAPFGGVPLIAFGNEPASAAPAPTAPAAVAPAAVDRPPPVAAKQVLPSPPETGGINGLIPRLSALLEWLRADVEVTRVIVVDDEGLPLIGSTSGDLSDAESLLAATGSVAGAMKKLALATPGALSNDFEGYVGESPVLQLVGLSAGSRAFVVGISRRSAFAKRDVDCVRDAFTRALSGLVVGGASVRPISTSRSGEG